MMRNLSGKIPLLVEFIFNGSFIVFHSFGQRIVEAGLLSANQFTLIDEGWATIVPFIVFFSLTMNYLALPSFDQLIRRHIFSIVIFFPLLLTLGDVYFAYTLGIVHLFASVLTVFDVTPLSTDRKAKLNVGFMYRLQLRPAQIVIASFIAIILTGALLLMLGVSHEDGVSVSLIDALFMATSAACVTGLATLSLEQDFSFFGQLVILVLIQVGGLGYMTLSSSMAIILGKAMGIKERVVLQDLLEISSFSELLKFVLDIVRYTIVIEFIGAGVLCYGYLEAGNEFGSALVFGIFHSISAFCNAGFSLHANGLEDFATNPIISMTVSVLIILGGLGFIVLREIREAFSKKRPLLSLGIHSKIVLTTSGILILFGTGVLFFSEFLHAFDRYSLIDKLMLSFFHSVTTRTAGFNTIAMNSFQMHSLYFMALFMFIGASPGSTGGGIKTSTFAILIQSIRSTLKGTSRVEVFERTVPTSMVIRAMAITIISLIIASFFILVLMRLEPEHSFMSIFFEVVSAFATTGLSLGITPYLTGVSKLVLVLVMFIGRVGPLTMALAIGKQKTELSELDYPEGRIMIG